MMQLRRHGTFNGIEAINSLIWACLRCTIPLKAPFATEIWKIFSDPVTSIYSDLDESSRNLEWFLNSILRCNREMSDLFIPKPYSHRPVKLFGSRQDQYQAFAVWLLNHVFYINGKMSLRHHHTSSINVQIKCLRSVGFQNDHIFRILFREYTHILEDIMARITKSTFASFILRRFRPNLIKVGAKLNLRPVYILVENLNLADHVILTVLKILGGVIDEKSPLTGKLYMKLLNVLNSTILRGNHHILIASIKVAEALFTSKKTSHLNKKIFTSFIRCLDVVMTDGVKKLSEDRRHKEMHGLIETLFELFAAMLRRKSRHYQGCNVVLTDSVLRFLEMDYISRYKEKREELMMIHSYVYLSNIPEEILDLKKLKPDTSSVNKFFRTMYTMEESMVNEALTNLKIFIDVAWTHRRDDWAYTVWCVPEKCPTWGHIVRMFDVLCNDEFKSRLYLIAYTRISCLVVQMALKLSFTLKEQLVISPVPCGFLEMAFFDGYMEKIYLTFANILKALEAEERKDAFFPYWEMIFHTVGYMIRVPSYVGSALSNIYTAIAFLSLPWNVEFEPDWEDSILVNVQTLSRLQKNIPGKFRIKLQSISITYLSLVHTNVGISKRAEILRMCFESKEAALVIKAIRSVPFFLKSGFSLEFAIELVLMLVKTLVVDNSIIYTEVAKVVGPLVCTLGGRGFVRHKLNPDPMFEMACEDCNSHGLKSPNEEFELLTPMFEHMDAFICLFRSNHPEVKLAMLKNIQPFANHTKYPNDTYLLSIWLELLEDADYNVRIAATEEVNNIMLPKSIARNAGLSLELFIDSGLSEEVLECRKWFDHVHMNIFTLVKKSLAVRKLSLQDTLLKVLVNISRTHWEYIVFPILKLFMLYMLHPGSLVSGEASNKLVDFCTILNLTKHQIFEAYREEFCIVIAGMIGMKMLDRKFKVTSLAKDMASLFEYSSAFDFLQGNLKYILPSLFPCIVERQDDKILLDMAYFLSTTVSQLLTNQFRYIYSYLYMNVKRTMFQKCMKFVREVGSLNIAHVKKISCEAIQNQFILYLHVHKEKATSGLHDLVAEFGKPKKKNVVTREDVAEYLQPKIFGILLFMDSFITTSITCIGNKEKALGCLPSLITLLGPKEVTPIKFKILVTLKTALRISGGNVLSLACSAWYSFVCNVETESLGALLSQVFISLLPVIDLYPTRVGAIFRYLVITKGGDLKEHIRDLYFVPNHKEIEDVYMAIQGVIAELWPKSFRDSIALMLKYITHEHVEVKINGLKKCRDYLQGHQTELQEFILNFGTEDSILSELIDALIIGCRARDYRIRTACGACFGEMGAIDSARLKRTSNTKDKEEFIFDICAEEFAITALSMFATAFLSAGDTTEMDRFALAIQIFLKTYLTSVESEENIKEFWGKFPVSLQQVITPFSNTRYMLESEVNECWKPHPIYGSSAGSNFITWIYRWVCNMISLEDNAFKLNLLNACRACLKYDTNVVIFLVPHIFTNAVLKADDEHSWKLIEEILAVMTSSPNKEEEKKKESNIRPVELITFIGEGNNSETSKEMRIMCLSTVFSLIDYLEKWIREWNHKFQTKDEAKDKRPMIIKNFLSKLDKLSIAKRSFECQEYPRALLYLERFVSDIPEALQDQLEFFEKIYARLNDPDAVAGVLAVQKKQATCEQLILSHEVKGQWQDAAACYEKMAQSGCPTRDYALGMVNCYLKLDQPLAARGLINDFSDGRPELEESLMESYMEALWKLGDWSQLLHYNEKVEAKHDNLWNVNIVNSLLILRDEPTEIVPEIQTLRDELMCSLCAMSIDKGAYERGYELILRTQILSELEKIAEITANAKKGIDEIQIKTMERHFKEFDDKLKYLHNSVSTLEPVLFLRRTMLHIVQEHFPDDTLLSPMLEKEIGNAWIRSAAIARDSGYFQQAYMYLLNAEKFNLKNVFIEKAKLFWERDENHLALLTLRKGIEENFPMATEYKVLKDQAPLYERKICAEAKLLLACYTDKNVSADIDENMNNYKDAVETYQKWEKNLVHLAEYYEKVLDAIIGDDDYKGREAQLHMINYFGKSLEFGCQYMYHSMPRMLTIWLDYGAKLIEKKERDRGEIFAKMTKLIETYAVRLPPFMFFSVFSQITTRLCHPHPAVYNVLKSIIAKVIITYPHQSMWMIMAVYKSSNVALAKKCEEIFNICKSSDRQIIPLINDYIKLAELLIALCNKKTPQTVHHEYISRLAPDLVKMLRRTSHSELSLPLQKFINITMPLEMDACPANHNAFPNDIVFISGIEESVFIFTSLQRPKKIVLRGSDGNKYTLICKAKDDLRKDLRVMEFNRIVNTYLRSDPEACQRSLRIRTYNVVPLNEDCGLIELVPNLVGLRSLLGEIYTKMGVNITKAELKKLICDTNDSLSYKRHVFLTKMLPRHPPVFDQWFYRMFSDPQAWYMARNAYIRSTAVMSMVGYVLGLGDRHGENILFDSTNGDTVHVDFSCIFNLGENSTFPEKVPFRLTHNMVKAMGSNGVEGMFRRCCEITLKILKRQSSTLIAVLTPIVYDPSISTRSSSDSDSIEVTNKKARDHLHNISQRLQGYINTKGGKFSLPLSTAGQVDKLIEEATSIDNLSQMYFGWGAHL